MQILSPDQVALCWAILGIVFYARGFLAGPPTARLKLDYGSLTVGLLHFVVALLLILR